jgi:murein DD-endopeptidase MepM/ murein hydrolase activator NlpD
LTVRGNATYIDHGWGVYTGYLHQSQLLVQAGDRVETGQLIGMVGNTGRATGPHLHWEVWVGGVPVQPLEWTSQSYPSSENGG